MKCRKCPFYKYSHNKCKLTGDENFEEEKNCKLVEESENYTNLEVVIMKEDINPFESLHNSITFDSRDWAKDKKDAWIYGIIVGWTSDDSEEMEGIFQEFNKKFNWDRDTWNRLQSLHKEYIKYKEMSER